MDITELHRRAAEGFATRLAAVGDDHWTLPTPCPEWRVRDLVEHVLGNHERAAALLGGGAPDPTGDATRRWTTACAAIRSGLSAPGTADRLAPSPFGGRAPVSDVVAILTTDLTAHTWDLARALGADDRLDPDVVAVLLPLVERAGPAMGATGKFAPPVDVPETAGAQRRFLALVGRDAV